MDAASVKKVFDTLLAKKFMKNLQAGYEPLEVDLFFDEMRAFLVTMMQFQNQLQATIAGQKEQLWQLQKTISQKDNTIKLLRQEIQNYEKDGYQSQRLLNQVGKLQVEIDLLKNATKKTG